MTPRLNHVSLFSGVGMGDLAVESVGGKTVATAEIDPWNRKVLAARFPDAHHFADVKAVTAQSLSAAGVNRVDILSGGFPCQDLSVAGHGLGLAGKRSGLWAEFARIIEDTRPGVVLIENVAVLRSRGLARLLDDLCGMGYDCRWDCIPAAAVGAPHLRDRIWIVAVPQTGEDRLAGWTDADLDDAGLIGCVGGKTGVLAPGGNRCVSKLPRAGHMTDGYVFEGQPRATLRDCRRAVAAGRELLPTPTKQDGSNNGGPGQMRRKSLPLNAYVKLYPTPRASPNEWRTLKGAPSHGKSHGATLAGTINDQERAAGRSPAPSSDSAGNLSPEWVEWLMGLPAGWTNPEVPNDKLVPHNGWSAEPSPRTAPAVKDRRKRLMALGNGLVPQAAAVLLSEVINEKED